jgi:hypothetical protein
VRTEVRYYLRTYRTHRRPKESAMKRLTSFVILTAASALVGCASQAPATPSGTGVSPAKVAATSPATGTGQTSVAATSPATGAQTSVAATSPATGAGQTSVAATASATADNGKFTVPVGWRRVEVNGQERFCRKYIETGSRVAQSETCLTKNQLENLQSGSQQFIQQIQRQGGEMTGQGGATTGGR